jgi:hypothetical protein
MEPLILNLPFVLSLKAQKNNYLIIPAEFNIDIRDREKTSWLVTRQQLSDKAIPGDLLSVNKDLRAEKSAIYIYPNDVFEVRKKFIQGSASFITSSYYSKKAAN